MSIHFFIIILTEMLTNIKTCFDTLSKSNTNVEEIPCWQPR